MPAIFTGQSTAPFFARSPLLVDRNEPIDVITVADRLLATGELDAAGGHTYLDRPRRADANGGQCQRLRPCRRERALLRKLIDAAQDIANAGFNPEGRSADELVDEAERLIMTVSESGPKSGGPQAWRRCSPARWSVLRSSTTPGAILRASPLVLSILDKKTSGLQPSDLVIVAGRPSMGKTSFAMNLVENASAIQKSRLLVFSMEMPAEQLVIRMMSSLGKIDQSRVRTGKLQQDDWPKLSSAMAKLKDTSIFIDDTPALTPTEVRARVASAVARAR